MHLDETMSTTVEESSTTDEFEAAEDRYTSVTFQPVKNEEEGTQNSGSIDRYSVNHDNQHSEEEEEEKTLDGESSFDSRTYGESTFVTDYDGESTFVTEGYDGESTLVTALDEEMSLESQHMIMDHFLDSSCACLNYPSIVYQNLCMETETSLLRESKGVPRSTIYQNSANAPRNLGIAAAKRRNVRIQGKESQKDERVNDAVSSAEYTTGSELRKERIQQKNELDSIDESSEVLEETEVGDTRDDERPSRLDTPLLSQSSSEDSQESEHSDHSEVSDISEEIIEKTETTEDVKTIPTDIKEIVERAIDNAAKEEKEREISIRVPKKSEESNEKIDPPTADEHLVDEELRAPTEPKESEQHRNVNVIEVRDNLTQLGEGIWSVPVTGHTARERDSQEANTAEDRQEHHDENSIISHEIINLVSLDEQDSWTPAIVEQTRDQSNDRRVAFDSSAVEKLRSEGEPKLNTIRSSNRGLSASRRDLVTAKSAEALWNEERRKLQTISDVEVRSQSRRQLIKKVLEGTRTENIFSNKTSEERLKSINAGRSRPSADRLSRIEISRIMQERGLTGRSTILQQGNTKSPPTESRHKDLVMAQRIEEAQRIRSSKHIASPQKADTHRYVRASPLRSRQGERIKSKLSQEEVDILKRSLARQKSRNKQPVSERFIDDPAKKYRQSEERDDHEFPTSFSRVANRPTTASEKNRSHFDTARSGTQGRRTLEQRIERKIHDADTGSNSDQSTEIRLMEQRLSNKLRSIIKADDVNAQKMSSNEIRKLDRHLTQTLKSESENRSARLQRIKNKERQHFTQNVPSSHAASPEIQQSNIHATKASYPSKQYLQESHGSRPESSRYDDIKGLRARYVRRSVGNRTYSRMTDSD